MTIDQIKSAASDLDDEDLRHLELWIRSQLDPPVAAGGFSGQPALELPGSEHLTYRLKYFRCGNTGCRCARGHLHGPYLFATRHAADGSHRQFYIGRVAVERPDEERQLELDLR
ncbi:MAG: hypothetical protein H7X80_08475 [bacterium]|nr:hypothetical protein [Candidatus Kapabacteria bacterium]